MNIVRKSLSLMLSMETDPYRIKTLCEIQQICEELGIDSNEASYEHGCIALYGRQRDGCVKYEAHIQILEEGMYTIYFSAFHDRPLKIAIMMRYDSDGHPFIADLASRFEETNS